MLRSISLLACYGISAGALELEHRQNSYTELTPYFAIVLKVPIGIK